MLPTTMTAIAILRAGGIATDGFGRIRKIMATPVQSIMLRCLVNAFPVYRVICDTGWAVEFR